LWPFAAQTDVRRDVGYQQVNIGLIVLSVSFVGFDPKRTSTSPFLLFHLGGPILERDGTDGPSFLAAIWNGAGGATSTSRMTQTDVLSMSPIGG
jgi:hypothetical protein